ncbi:hypothetical protein [Neomoorella thermoacetica]|uniref:hypothetical protein n=1 Tax=Neomoorella thermoacetica TaxID=1525 RepID=UPI0030D0B993
MSKKFAYSPEYWASQVKRYMWTRLDSIWNDTRGDPRSSVLEFLESLTISRDDLRWLALLYHVTEDAGAWEFVVRKLPEYLSTLSREKKSKAMTDRQRPRGRVMWGKTLRCRAERADPTLFVTAVPSRTYDSPENELVKKYLKELAGCHVPSRNEVKASVGKKLVETVLAAADILAASFFQEVSSPREVTVRMLSRAEKDRRPIYGKVAQLWREYEATVLDQNLKTLKEILVRGWISPKIDGDVDHLFELYVLVSVLEALEDLVAEGDSNAVEYGLVRSGKTVPVARYSGPTWKAEVFFDRSPAAALGVPIDESAYGRTLRLYRGLSGASRRPDVLVSLKSVDQMKEVRLLVEAKNADPESEYGGDSVYKALGYVRDFSDIWRREQRPKVILAFPGGTIPVSVDAFFEEDVAIISGDLQPQLRMILARLLNQP